MKKLTPAGIGALTLAAAMALALPAQANGIEIDQDAFVADCADGAVAVPAGTELKVVKDGDDADPGVITVDCTVTLMTAGGTDSELQLGEDTNLLFQDGDDFKNFTITGAGTGSEVEVQVKKNSTIEARDFMVTIGGGMTDEAEAQFEENFCLRLHADEAEPFEGGNLLITAGSPGEGGDVQFKKFEGSTAVFTDGMCGTPNIEVDGSITITVTGGDSEAQIEEEVEMEAGGDINLTGIGAGSQVQTKKLVVLTALGVAPATFGDITLSAASTGGEVQVEDDNDFDAVGDIVISSGPGGKTEVKRGSLTAGGGGTDLDAGGTLTVSSGGECKIEADTSKWSAGGGVTTAGCELTFTP